MKKENIIFSVDSLNSVSLVSLILVAVVDSESLKIKNSLSCTNSLKLKPKSRRRRLFSYKIPMEKSWFLWKSRTKKAKNSLPLFFAPDPNLDRRIPTWYSKNTKTIK